MIAQRGLSPEPTRLAAPPATRGLARIARRWLLELLERVEVGTLTVADAEGRLEFGSGRAPHATLKIVDPRFWIDVALGGSVGLGEAYVNGYWLSPDPVALLALLHRNPRLVAGADRALARVPRAVDALRHALRANTLRGSRQNIAAHYDLGNDFFERVLDPTLSYSCALFRDEITDLEAASRAKIARVLSLLTTGLDLLEIGTGWGALAEQAATEGFRVTTTTISRAQFRYATERMRRQGLSDRVQVLGRDWRKLRGEYDGIACIEMIEAVGHRNYVAFFEKCSGLLRPGGRLALQAIVIGDDRFDWSKHRVDFIKKHVFPGSCLPSRAVLRASVEKTRVLRCLEEEDLTEHYPKTLRAWRARLATSGRALAELGYSEELRRAWDYYLALCEAAFLERHIGNVMMLVERRP